MPPGITGIINAFVIGMAKYYCFMQLNIDRQIPSNTKYEVEYVHIFKVILN